MNSFFGFSVVEKLRLIGFDDDQSFLKSHKNIETNVTKSKYQNKIKNIKNEKIKKYLIKLAKVFREK